MARGFKSVMLFDKNHKRGHKLLSILTRFGYMGSTYDYQTGFVIAWDCSDPQRRADTVIIISIGLTGTRLDTRVYDEILREITTNTPPPGGILLVINQTVRDTQCDHKHELLIESFSDAMLCETIAAMEAAR